MNLRFNTLIGILCAIGAAVVFALSLVAARSSYDYGSNPQTVMFSRFILLVTLVFVWNRGRNLNTRIQVKDRLFCALMGPASDPEEWVGKVDGFSLHAGVACKAHERKKLERLCRYITRPAVAEKRLSLSRNGMVRYELKSPYRDGTTHVIFEPLDFISKRRRWFQSQE